MGEDSQRQLRVYMVGDNPESGESCSTDMGLGRIYCPMGPDSMTDIAGAIAHGWESILVKTGVYKNGEPRHRPSVISDDVEKGVQWAIERELNIGR